MDFEEQMNRVLQYYPRLPLEWRQDYKGRLDAHIEFLLKFSRRLEAVTASLQEADGQSEVEQLCERIREVRAKLRGAGIVFFENGSLRSTSVEITEADEAGPVLDLGLEGMLQLTDEHSELLIRLEKFQEMGFEIRL
jgi:hypothetical protein